MSWDIEIGEIGVRRSYIYLRHELERQSADPETLLRFNDYFHPVRLQRIQRAASFDGYWYPELGLRTAGLPHHRFVRTPEFALIYIPLPGHLPLLDRLFFLD